MTLMKKAGMLAMGMILSAAAWAQTADEIIGKHVEAIGGRERLDNLKSIKRTGSMSTQGIDIAMTLTNAHNVGMRMDMDIMGSNNYQIMNNTEGWAFMPVMGMTEPKKMEDEQYKAGLNQLDVQGPLYNYQAKGNKVEMVGKEKLDGGEAFKLKLTNGNGKSTDYFIDAKTYYLVKTSSKTNVQGQDMDVETTFSDFKQTPDGYWFPYTMTTMQGTISFEKIEPNVKVDEAMFKN